MNVSQRRLRRLEKRLADRHEQRLLDVLTRIECLEPEALLIVAEYLADVITDNEETLQQAREALK